MNAKENIAKIEANLKNKPDLNKTVNAIFKFQIEGDDGGVWTLDLTKSPGELTEGETATPSCTIIMNTEDFQAMIDKTANPMQLYMQQKLKVQGNLPLSLKLQEIL